MEVVVFLVEKHENLLILRDIGQKCPLLVLLLFPSFESVNGHEAFIGIPSVSMGALVIHSLF